MSEPTFRVDSLSTTSCRTIEHNAVSGDDRGGIAVSTSQVFYTGDTSTVQALLTDLSGLAPAGSIHDGLLSDLTTGQVYVLLSAMGAEGVSFSGTFTAAQLGLLDGATATLSRTRIPLSAPITMQSGSGIFSGRGRAYVLTPNSAGAQTWYQIRLPSGAVTVLRSGAPSFRHQVCENWAFWGVAEHFGGEAYALYVEDNTHIVRYRVRDGSLAPLVTLAGPTAATSLSDMCSFTVSPVTSRWYFHYEGAGFAGGVDETLGFCPATLSTP